LKWSMRSDPGSEDYLEAIMIERLQKIIAASGLTSRRNAEAMIAAGRVVCNGRVCTLGESADPVE
jgi:16S rRNA U516 pseudouridylate synthase RsuA-like enzyme